MPPPNSTQWLGLDRNFPPPIWVEQWGSPLVTMTIVAGGGLRVLEAIGSILPWQLGAMWGWCQRNMPFHGRARGCVTGPSVLGEPLVPPVAGPITTAAPEIACCGALCSHSEVATMETNNLLGGPLPSASHPILSTQVGYLGVFMSVLSNRLS